MVLKSECSELIGDYVILLQKQTEGFTKKELTEVLEVLCAGNREGYPYIQMGEDAKLYLVFDEDRKEIVSSENIREVFDYERYKKSGIIGPFEKAA